MNKLFTLFFVLVIQYSYAQKNDFDHILHGEKLEIVHYNKSDLKPNQLYLESPFAKCDLQTNAEFEKIKSLVIYRIDLVYTTYAESPAFNQDDLNRQRLIALNKIAPSFFGNPLITWGQIAITGAHNPKEGKDMFHGFIFTYREPASILSRTDEILFIKELLGDTIIKKVALVDSTKKSGKVKMPVYHKKFYDEIEYPVFDGGDEALRAYLQKNVKYPKNAVRDHKEGEVTVSFIVGVRGDINKVSLISGIDESCNNEVMHVVEKMPKWIPGKRNGKSAAMRISLPVAFIWPDKVVQADTKLVTGKTREYRTRGKFEELIVDSVDAPETYYKFMAEQDSSIFKILNRNHWKNTLFVCDVTGSMSPYISQLLLWYKLNLTKGLVKHFFFFNDGNGCNDYKKRIGATGGIYHASANEINQVTSVLYEAMINGDGGDIPENNIEAVLEAIRMFPEYTNVVLVADNFATPRDLELLSKIKIPIKFILCGTYVGINTKYMDMVKQNKGSLHTIDDDIINLVNLNEGEEISIDGISYKLKSGIFETIKKQ